MIFTIFPFNLYEDFLNFYGLPVLKKNNSQILQNIMNRSKILQNKPSFIKIALKSPFYSSPRFQDIAIPKSAYGLI